MKGLAFALDPDEYWIELVERDPGAQFPQKYNLSQTMLRVKDATKTVAFYRDFFSMDVLRESQCVIIYFPCPFIFLYLTAPPTKLPGR